MPQDNCCVNVLDIGVDEPTSEQAVAVVAVNLPPSGEAAADVATARAKAE